jgi:hypothetical protein
MLIRIEIFRTFHSQGSMDIAALAVEAVELGDIQEP